MKRWALASALALGFAGPGWAADAAQSAASAWNVTFASDVRYYSWEGNRGYPVNVNTSPGRGSEIYTPLALSLSGKPSDDVSLTFLVRGGWVKAQQSTPGLTGAIDTATDTVASATLTYLGLRGVQPFAGLSVNLPTGTSALYGSASAARMDPDLVEIASFGEGLNIGPTLGANIAISPALMFTASVGYTWRGRFDRERSLLEPNPALQAGARIDPGDVVTGTATLAYQAAPWTVKLSTSVSEETTTRDNNVDLYRTGRRYLVTGSVSHAWPEQWGQTTVSASWAHTNHNDVKFLALPSLVKEMLSTNSDLYRADIQHLFAVSPNFVIGPTASYLHRDANGYDPGTLQFVPAKDRTALGTIARFAVSGNVTLNVRGERVWTRENDAPAPGNKQFSVLANGFVAAIGAPVVSSTGWVLVGGVNAKF
jgi:hypothetical protein